MADESVREHASRNIDEGVGATHEAYRVDVASVPVAAFFSLGPRLGEGQLSNLL